MTIVTMMRRWCSITYRSSSALPTFSHTCENLFSLMSLFTRYCLYHQVEWQWIRHMWSRTTPLSLFLQVYASKLISIGSISSMRLPPTMTTITSSIWSSSERENSFFADRQQKRRNQTDERKALLKSRVSNDKAVRSARLVPSWSFVVSMGLRWVTDSILRTGNNEVGHFKSLLQQLPNWCQSEWYSPERAK